MTVSTCPIATVNASVERVWSLLSEPASYAQWWDAHTRSIAPVGPSTPGQRIYAQSKAFGRQWEVNIVVEKVDESRRQVQLRTMLPLGITVYNTITCTPLDEGSCRVSFG